MSQDLLSLIARETQLHRGSVSRVLDGEAVPPGHHRLSGCEFMLCAERFALHYRKGEGVTVDLAEPEARGQMELMLAGSMRAAIACLNGLFPLHASAMAVNGRVIAFSGPSGSGKSTLAAALNRRGFALYCDDTLVLDPNPSPPVCLPGHKRLKLWPDAVELTGCDPLDLVSEHYRKYYCTPGGCDVTEPLPLGALVRIEQGQELALVLLRGGQRIAAIADDHYTVALHQAAQGYGAQGRLALLSRLAASVPVYRFTRPFSRSAFERSTEFLIDQLDRLAT